MAFRAVSYWAPASMLVCGLALGVGCGESERSPREPVPSGGGGGGGEPSDAGAPSEGARPSGGSSGGGGGSASAGEAGAPVQPAPDVALSALRIYQTLEVPLMEAGQPVPSRDRPVPLIAGKRALVRAFVELGERYEPRPLLGVLDLRQSGREHSIVSERTLAQSSAADDLESTFTFDVAAEDLTPDSRYRVRVLEADTTPLARFPEADYAPLTPEEAAPFRLVVVPYVANGFTPKTSEEEVASLRRRLLALYPSRDVEVSVASPVTLPFPVDEEEAGWDEALDLIYDLRRKADPEPDVFYYGLLAPAASYDAYCPRGCLLGLAYIADEGDADERAAIGIGVFPDGSGGEDAVDTTAHELGHALGRDHAPCKVAPSDTDPSWPDDTAHRNAMIGLYGYDFDFDRLIKPRLSKDVMSYCAPAWISDYTYAGIFERLASIRKEASTSRSVLAPQALRVARIGRSGQTRWLAPLSKVGARLATSVALLDGAGRVVGAAPSRFARVDHGAGGKVWLPEKALRQPGAVSVDLRPFGGAVLPL